MMHFPIRAFMVDSHLLSVVTSTAIMALSFIAGLVCLRILDLFVGECNALCRPLAVISESGVASVSRMASVICVAFVSCAGSIDAGISRELERHVGEEENDRTKCEGRK